MVKIWFKQTTSSPPRRLQSHIFFFKSLLIFGVTSSPPPVAKLGNIFRPTGSQRRSGRGWGGFRMSRGSSRYFRGTDRQNEEHHQKAREMFLWSIFDCRFQCLCAAVVHSWKWSGGEALFDLLRPLRTFLNFPLSLSKCGLYWGKRQATEDKGWDGGWRKEENEREGEEDKLWSKEEGREIRQEKGEFSTGGQIVNTREKEEKTVSLVPPIKFYKLKRYYLEIFKG